LLGKHQLGLQFVLVGENQHVDSPTLALRHKRWGHTEESVVVGDHEWWLDILLQLAGSGNVVQLEDFVVAIRKGCDELDKVLLVRPDLLCNIDTTV